MKNKEIEEILYVLKHIVIGRATRLTCREADKLLSYIEQLEQENQQLKKQKDDVVELIKKQLLSNTNITKYTDEMCLRDVLRMLGEIDE